MLGLLAVNVIGHRVSLSCCSAGETVALRVLRLPPAAAADGPPALHTVHSTASAVHHIRLTMLVHVRRVMSCCSSTPPFSTQPGDRGLLKPALQGRALYCIAGLASPLITLDADAVASSSISHMRRRVPPR